MLTGQANNYFCSCTFPTSYGAGADCGPTTYFVSTSYAAERDSRCADSACCCWMTTC